MSWQDPYGQYGYGAQQGWQDPYAGQGYGYGYGPPGVPPGGGGSNGSAIGALVCNIVSAVLCCAGVAWLPGIILAGLAMGRTQSNPESARQLSIWSWVCFALNIVLVAAFVILLVVTGYFEDDYYSTY